MKKKINAIPFVTHMAGEFWVVWRFDGQFARCVNRKGVRRFGPIDQMPIVKNLAIVNGKTDKYAITKNGYLNLTTGLWADEKLEKVIRAYLHTDLKKDAGFKPKVTRTKRPSVMSMSDEQIENIAKTLPGRYFK
jgi:hypothetical protein